MKRIDNVIVRPIVTEKVSADTEANNTYAFEVGRAALGFFTGGGSSPPLYCSASSRAESSFMASP